MGDGDQHTTQPGSEEELRGGARWGGGGTRTCIVAVVLKN